MDRNLLILVFNGESKVLQTCMACLAADPKITCFTAPTCQKALEALANQYELPNGGHINAAVVDLELPDSNGVDIIPKMLELSPDTAIVALSDRPELEEAALKAGAISFIYKNSPTACGKEFVKEVRISVIKNNIRLCHLPKEQAITKAKQLLDRVRNTKYSGEFKFGSSVKNDCPQ